MKILVLALAFVLGATGIVSAQNGPIVVEHAWARPTPPNAVNAAVYFTIKNTGMADDTLIGADIAIAAKAEAHESSMENGIIMKMRPLSDVAVPAGGAVDFKPGGKHLMLLGLKAPLTTGESFSLTLKFKNAGVQTVKVDVVKTAPMDDMPGMDMHH